MNSLKTILLIDDDAPTNFLNKYIINTGNYTEECFSVNNTEAAISFIKKYSNQKGFLPELIFLDLNMPGLDGWDFLKIYQSLKLEAKTNIYILSTSTREMDRLRLEKYSFVKGYHTKPLSNEKLDGIFKEIHCNTISE